MEIISNNYETWLVDGNQDQWLDKGPEKISLPGGGEKNRGMAEYLTVKELSECIKRSPGGHPKSCDEAGDPIPETRRLYSLQQGRD